MLGTQQASGRRTPRTIGRLEVLHARTRGRAPRPRRPGVDRGGWGGRVLPRIVCVRRRSAWVPAVRSAPSRFRDGSSLVGADCPAVVRNLGTAKRSSTQTPTVGRSRRSPGWPTAARTTPLMSLRSCPRSGRPKALQGPECSGRPPPVREITWRRSSAGPASRPRPASPFHQPPCGPFFFLLCLESQEGVTSRRRSCPHPSDRPLLCLSACVGYRIAWAPSPMRHHCHPRSKTRYI